jgi:glycosyltransferase involved in cell wall biosynthesis
MKLALISTILGYPWGGADTLWTRAAEAALDRGDQVLLSVSPTVASHPRVAAMKDAGAEIVLRTLPPARPSLTARVRRKLGLPPRDDARLIRALRRFQPDRVIFSQGGTYDLILHPELAAGLRSHRVDYQIIANWQEEEPHLDDASLQQIRAAFGAASVINFVSTRNLEVTRRHLALPLPHARVIQNPLRWTPADVTAWPDKNISALATMSRLDEGKGIHLLLHALASTTAILPTWELNIYGQGPSEENLRALVRQLGLDAHVRFRGYVKDLRAVWAENHLMVSPALEDGVPMTIPEAMLCRRPVLATCVGGATDWITPARTGFLCPTRDAVALATTLRDAFAQRDHWEKMGAAAADSALERYRSNDHLLLIN